MSETSKTAGEFGQKIKAWAEEVILDANTLLHALQVNPNLQQVPPHGMLDHEPWTIARFYARKIVAAVDAKSYIDPSWPERIKEAMAALEATP